MPAGRPISLGSTFGVGQFVDDLEDSVLDALDHQLGDPVPAPKHHRLPKIVIDQAYPDFASVASVNGSGRVHHAEPGPGGKPGPGMHEGRVPGRQRDRDARADHGALAWRHGDIDGRHEVGSGVGGTGVGRERNPGIKPGQQHLNAGHDGRDYPCHVTASATTGNEDHARPGETGGRPQFRERLYVPWWHWVLPVIAAALLAAEVHMGFPVVPAWLPYLFTIPLALFAMTRLSRVVVELKDGELWAADAHLPVEFIGAVDAVTGTEKRKALGPYLDPAAFVMHRGWVPSMVRLQLDDPADPTPYWLVSVRHPDRLITALTAASQAAAP